MIDEIHVSSHGENYAVHCPICRVFFSSQNENYIPKHECIPVRTESDLTQTDLLAILLDLMEECEGQGIKFVDLANQARQILRKRI